MDLGGPRSFARILPMPFFAFLALLPVDLRQDIQAFHDRMARQYVTKAYDDMVAMATDRFLPEFAYARIIGPPLDLLSMSNMRDAELKNLKVGRSDGPIRWRTQLNGWQQKGDILTFLAHHMVDGEWLKADGRHPVHFDSAVRETWVRRDGTWKALRWQEVWLRATMDGKTQELGSRPTS